MLSNNNKMNSVTAQQNKQQEQANRGFPNKFMSIKSILRNKKIIIKKSVPSYATCYNDGPNSIMDSGKVPNFQRNRERVNSARSQSDKVFERSGKNVINIKFDKNYKCSQRQKEIKIRRRMFSNFVSNEAKKIHSPQKEQKHKKIFEDTLTIQPIIKIDKDFISEKRKHINSSLNNHYMLLTKRNTKKSGSSFVSATQTITDFQPVGKAIDYYHRSSNTSFGYKTINNRSGLEKKRRNFSKIQKKTISELIEEAQNFEKKTGSDSISSKNEMQEEGETKEMQESGTGNIDQKDFKDLIPVRKPLNRKDHFVFGMSQKPSNEPQNKIELYRDFLWKINYSNGLYVITPENIDFSYKAYFGHGNNSIMLKSILRRRHWWHIIETSDKNSLKDCHFVWTQLKVNNLFKPQENGQEMTYLQNDESATQIRNMYKDFMCSESESEESKLLFYHSKLFNQIDFKNWLVYYKKHKKVQQKITEQTFIKRCSLYRRKEIRKIADSNKLRMHNHLEFNYYLGNKKALFYNIKRICQFKGEDPFNYVPLTFHIAKGVQDPCYDKFLAYYQKMEEIKKVDKTFKNIWICKPGQNTNRGNGISVCLGLDDVKHRLRGREKNSDGKPRTFILQKYIQKPFLFRNRKFDIRHYMLITCFNGNMKAYWYQEGYIRTSSTQYSLKNTKDLFVHLTNDAVQKKCEGYGKHEKGNKISYEEFQRYLNTNYKKKKFDFLGKTMRKMKELALTSVEATYAMLDPKRRQHNFELIGLDFMLDENFVPWLIEANTNPCLELSCPLLEKMIPNLIEQVYRICIDPFFPPPQNWINSKKQFFGENTLLDNKFELIFDERVDGGAIQQLIKNAQSQTTNYDQILNKIEEDDQVFEDDGNENWQENANN